MRLLSPSDKCIEVDVNRNRYKGTTINVTNPADQRKLKEAGYTTASISGPPVKSSGWICPDCAFHGFFRVCGRCGEECQRG